MARKILTQIDLTRNDPITYVHLRMDGDRLVARSARVDTQIPPMPLPQDFLYSGSLLEMRADYEFERCVLSDRPDYSIVRLFALYPSVRRTRSPMLTYVFEDRNEFFHFRMTWETVA